MNDRIFLDTKILVYAYAVDNPIKTAEARRVASHSKATISTQVLQEFANIMDKEFGISWPQIRVALQELESNFYVHTNQISTVHLACEISRQYDFKYYDSLIVAAAIESNCSRLYIEDLFAGKVMDGSLLVVNPFMPPQRRPI